MDQPARQAAIYCRISDDRVKDTLGVKRQERACREIAERRRWPIAGVFVDDDRSAFHGKPRPGYQAMVEAIKAGEVTAVVAWAPARLTRHPRELEDLIDLLEAHRVEVATHIAGDYDLATSGGRLTARIVGSVARHESEEKSERVRLKMDELARNGAFHGGRRPFGYAKDGTTVIPEEAAVIRMWVARVLAGVSLRSIAAETEALGIPTVTGSPWRFTAITHVLGSPRIAGLRVHKGQIVGPAAWPAIIERDDWDALVAHLGDPSRRQAKAGVYPLSGLVFSADGRRMTGRTIGKKGAYKRAYVSSAKRNEISITAEPLEAFITQYVLALTDNLGLPAPENSGDHGLEVATTEAELVDLAALRGNGTITMAEWLAARAPLVARIEAARQAATPRLPNRLAGILASKGGLRAAWPDMDDIERRQALGAFLERIIVYPASRPGPFDVTRIEPHRRRPA